MPAYLIAQVNVTDPARFQEYARLAGPIAAKHGCRYLVRGGAKIVLEGNLPYDRIVVAEYPDIESARRFYDSAEYQAARQKRLGAGEVNMVLIEGA